MTVLTRLLRSSLFVSAGVYTLSNMVNALIPFLLLPYLTHRLSPQEYGVVAMFQILAGIAVPFIGINVHGAINRQVVEQDTVDLPRYVGNCVFILLASTVVTGALIWLLAEPISRFSAFPASSLWMVVAYAFFQFLLLIQLGLWQMQVKPFAYLMLQVTQAVLSLGLTLWLVEAAWGWMGRVGAQVASSMVVGLIALAALVLSRSVRFQYRREDIDHALGFGVPLIPHTLGAWAMFATDRVFLTNLIGVAETGLYAVAHQIGMTIGLLQNSFNQAWVPWLFKKLKQDDEGEKRRIVRFTYAYFVGILALVVLLALASPWLLSVLVAPQYQAIGGFIFWIALGQAFNGMYKMVTNYIFYANKTSILAWVTFTTAVVNIPLSYVLITLNGSLGASQATAAALFLSFVATWLLSSRVYRMPWRLDFGSPRGGAS